MSTTRSHPGRAGAIAALIALLPVAGCTTNPATGEQSFTAFMSEEDEARVGADEHPKIIREFGGVYDDNEDEIDAYVAQLGGKLVGVSEMPTATFTFTVLDFDVVNAFALPGGYVYISRGLVALAENEAEIAGVIAHEIGHVTARHTAQRYSQAMAANIGLSIFGILGSVAGLPTQANDLLSVGATAVLQGYSREQELQADMLGVRYMTRAGYDPSGMRSFFEKMAGNDELRSRMIGQPTGEESYNFTSSHPRTSDRIQQAIDLASATDVANPVTNRELFGQIDGMIFGDSPSQGIRRGQTFSHADLGITFTVPPGYVLQNEPSAVVSLHPDGGRIIFDAEFREYRDLKYYLTDVWGKNFRLDNVERIDVNGFEAWTGRTRGRTRAGEREIRLTVLRDDRKWIYRIAFVIPPEIFDAQREDLQRATYSFRRLSAAEIASLKPLRIRVARPTSGATIADMEGRMEIERFPSDWFRLINRNILLDGSVAGDQVKLIAE